MNIEAEPAEPFVPAAPHDNAGAPAEAPFLSAAMRRVDELVPYARNSNIHTPKHVEQLAASIANFGWTNAVIADAKGIVAGHGRVLAAKLLYSRGERIRLPNGALLPSGRVPVIDCTGWDEAKRRAYIIADNQLGRASDFDNAILAEEIAALAEQEFDLGLLGFSEKELAKLAAGDIGDGENESAPGPSLADRFMVPPFSVLNAREGWWQDRKREWLAIGIASELGRGEGSAPGRVPLPLDRISPGGSPRPSMKYRKDRARGDGRGRSMPRKGT